MASETFEKVLVKDDKIGCITPKVKFQVLKGGQNITAQPFKAISETISSHVYNVTVPSLETIISREVLWQSTVTLKITGTQKPAGQFLVDYGVTDALAPFPHPLPGDTNDGDDQQQHREHERHGHPPGAPADDGPRGAGEV